MIYFYSGIVSRFSFLLGFSVFRSLSSYGFAFLYESYDAKTLVKVNQRLGLVRIIGEPAIMWPIHMQGRTSGALIPCHFALDVHNAFKSQDYFHFHRYTFVLIKLSSYP